MHHVRTSAKPLHHLAGQFGRVLEIGVDDDGGVGGHEVEAGGDRDLVAPVLSQVEHLGPAIPGGQPVQYPPRIVRAPVIDKEELVAHVR